jgi:uncharacterized protein YkwD
MHKRLLVLLAALLVVCACAGPAEVLSQSTIAATGESHARQSDDARPETSASHGFAPLEQASLDLVNAARRDRGLEPMRVDPLLSRIAAAHAADMQARGYYAHESPSGRGVQDRHDRAGGAEWRLIAENIARCSRCTEPPTTDNVREFHDRWMGSPGHRENILSPGLDTFGFGVVHGADGFFLVQNFAGPGMPSGFRSGDSLTPLAPDAQAEDALARVNAARARAGLAPVELSAALSRAIRETLPRRGDRDFDVHGTGSVQQAVPDPQRARWTSIGTIYGACGACGRDPVAADIRFFIAEWLEKPAFQALLLNPEATHLGFGIVANGEGRKVALAALGTGG